MKQPDLDCVVVAFHDMDFQTTVENAKASREHSGFYDYLKQNSLLMNGRRRTFMDYLNDVVGEARGTTSDLDVARLPNLPACYLKSYLDKRGLRTEIVNYLNLEKDRLRALLDEKPPVVAVSTTFYTDPTPVAQIVKLVRETNTETRIIVGGPYIHSIFRAYDVPTQDFILQQMGADIFVHDFQGESALAQIVNALKSGSEAGLEDIPNLVYRRGANGFARTNRAPESNDMDACTIDWTLFAPEYLRDTVQMRTARGCAFRCSFCLHHVAAGSHDVASVDAVEREMKTMQQMGVKRVAFIDDTLNVPLRRFKEILEMMIRNKFGFEWFGFLRAANADKEAFDLMQDSGCQGVFLGIESGNDGILKNMNKSAKIERLKEGVRQLHEHGIFSLASFIVGFPGETEATVDDTIEFIQDAKPTFYHGELWYCDTQTPIFSRKDEFQIRGAGYSWQHKTMNWREASAHVKRMYETVTESTLLPVWDFDFWSIPYLLREGFTFEQIRGFVSIAGKMLVRGLSDREADPADHEEMVSMLRA